MVNLAVNNCKAGFWVRLAALLIDFLIIWMALKLVIAFFIYAGVYVPFELTLGLSFLLYSVLLIGWQGRTLGKGLCGLTVKSSRGKHAGYLRALLRETVCKLISAVFLFLGFIWAGFSRKKRAWHDYIAGTIVIQDPQRRKRTPIALLAAFVLSVFLIGGKPLSNIWSSYCASSRMRVPSNILMPYTNRDPSTLVEISSLAKDDRTKFIEWLDLHGKEPVEYAVKTAAKHQVTIVHQQKDYLLFLNKIIPELYHRAGVTCVAMEVCLAEDNKKINQLVTAPEFDRELALEIA
ncbi:MAG: RDD family protein, partial [Planctomycetota bacterium]